jgi:hypothetical protein
MGWKAIKDHYRIRHQVAVYPEKGICIGSSYIHDIIRLHVETKTISTCRSANPPGFSNEDLARCWAEFHNDLDMLWDLAAAPDTFEESLPVFTYERGEVLQLECEAYDWPNVTHDGRIMYENTFFPTREQAVAYGKRDAELAVQYASEHVKRREEELAEALEHLAQEQDFQRSIQSA